MKQRSVVYPELPIMSILSNNVQFITRNVDTIIVAGLKSKF